MFNLIKPIEVRCRNCQHVGVSKINNSYRTVCVLLLVVAILGMTLPQLNFGLTVSRKVWVLETIWFLPLVATFAAFFSPNAHSCEKCGSTFLREV